MPWSTKKVEDEELEQILDENPYQIQLKLASEFEVTQQIISYRLQKLRKIRKNGSRCRITPGFSKQKRLWTPDLGWEILPYATYSPDLTFSDYHLLISTIPP